MRDKVQFGRIVRASRCGRWRCKIYRGIAQSRLQRAAFRVSSFSDRRRMRSRDSQTYLRARENLSQRDGRYLQNAPAIDNERRHARRSCYIEFLSCSASLSQGLSRFRTDEFVQTFFTPGIPIRCMPIR